MRKSLFVIVVGLLACTIPTPESSANNDGAVVQAKADTTVNEFKSVVLKTGEVNRNMKRLIAESK